MSEAVVYKDSPELVSTDGRDIDPKLGTLSGEASHQIAGPVEEHLASFAQTWEQLPEPDSADPTYYDRAMLKPPVWGLYIPAYYFVGGAAGAALALGAAAQYRGSPELNNLVRRAHWVGIIGSTIGSGLLILDLGRPDPLPKYDAGVPSDIADEHGIVDPGCDASGGYHSRVVCTVAHELALPGRDCRLRLVTAGAWALDLYRRAGCQQCHSGLAGIAARSADTLWGFGDVDGGVDSEPV